MSRVIDLAGKLAVITGATGGVGRDIVRTLAEAGADVAIGYGKNAQYAEQLRDEVIQKYGVRAMAVQNDVTDEASTLAMRDAIRTELGDPDICVLAPMVPCEWKLIMDQDMDTYVEQFMGFAGHAIAMSHAFIPHMQEQKWGRMIVINTECAEQLFTYQSAYAATKRAMDGVCRVLAREVGPDNITVNQIGPGWVVTELLPLDEDACNWCQDFPYLSRVPLKKRPTSRDIANAVLFFASDMADCITGEFMMVNGGNIMTTI